MAALTARQLAEYREWLWGRAQAQANARRVARTERQRAEALVAERAYSDALFHFDEMQADVVTIRLADETDR